MIYTLLLFLLGSDPNTNLPAVDVVDERGRVRSTAEWRGTPTIIAPMYTRCPLACPMIVQGLKRGVAESSAPASAYRVVVFSFDDGDTPADLQRFRERQRIPLGWTVVKAAKPGDSRRMLDSLGYRYAQSNGHFVHPNAVIALTADLNVAKVLYGTQYDVDDALSAARGGRDLVGRYGGWMLGALLLVALLSAVYLLTLTGQRAAVPSPRA